MTEGGWGGLLAGDVGVEVSPVGILLGDQVQLALAGAGLDLFFASDGRGSVGRLLEPDQLVNIVAGGEAWDRLCAVFVDTADEVVGDAGVESRMAAVGENVDVELSLHGAGW